MTERLQPFEVTELPDAINSLDALWSDARYRILAGENISLLITVPAFQSATRILASPDLGDDQRWPIDRIRNEAFERIAHSFGPFIRETLIKVLNTNHSSIIHDSYPVGQIALMMLAEEVDTDGRRNNAVAAFFRGRLRWRIIDILRDYPLDTLRRGERNRVKALREAQNSFSPSLDQGNQEDHVRKILGLESEEDYKKFLDLSELAAFDDAASLNMHIGHDYEDDKYHLSDQLIDLSESGEEVGLLDIVDAILENPDRLGLTDRELFIFKRWFLQRVTLKDIGDELGVTESAMSLASTKIIKKLKERRRAFSINDG